MKDRIIATIVIVGWTALFLIAGHFDYMVIMGI